MLAGEEGAGETASRIAAYFAGQDDENPIGSHARPIGIHRAREVGLKVEDMRAESELVKLVRELHHVLNIMFAETGAYKLVENQNGDALIRSVHINVQAGPEPPGDPSSGGAPGKRKPPPPPPREKRRR